MEFLDATESLASIVEVREVGALRCRRTRCRRVVPPEFGLWLSLVERLPRVQEVQGSNPCSPTFGLEGRTPWDPSGCEEPFL
jgi:hypothetical protein